MFRKSQWNPVRIVAQIVAMQSMFYVCLGLWAALLDAAFAQSLHLGQLFSWREFTFHSIPGVITIGAGLGAAVTSAFGMAWIVERSRKCLDFAATVYVWHVVATWAYAGFPPRLIWWVMHVISMAVMCTLGEYMCHRNEMQEIPLFGKALHTGEPRSPPRVHTTDVSGDGHDHVSDDEVLVIDMSTGTPSKDH